MARFRNYVEKQWERELGGQDSSLQIKELELNSICMQEVVDFMFLSRTLLG